MRKYDRDTKRAAVRLGRKLGWSAAARELGIPSPTIKTWSRLARLRATREQYGDHRRPAVLRLSEEIGPTYAARALAVPHGTVTGWRSVHGLTDGSGRRGPAVRAKSECYWCGEDMALPGLCSDECRREYVADALAAEVMQ